MTTGQKISELRRENRYTQEQLADSLQVSRQSISKWESDLAFPETDKLIKISKLFSCSVDYLLKDEVAKKTVGVNDNSGIPLYLNQFSYEYKSKATLFGFPLIHINLGINKKAKGIIAIGTLAYGFLSIGLFSIGLFSIGLVSIGLLALGAFSFGVAALGAICIGFFAFGAIAIGMLLAMGALAIEKNAVGALAIGNYLAVGDVAFAKIAIGARNAKGSFYSFCSGLPNYFVGYDKAIVTNLIDTKVPVFFRWISAWILTLL